MATDQEIRNQGYKYISPQYYLQNPFELQTTQTTQTENPGGIISTNAAMPYMGYPSYEAWLAAQRGGEGGGAGGDDDDTRPTGTFNWRDFPSLINLARKGIGWGVDKFKGWQDTRAANKESDLMDDIGAHNFEAASKINPDILSPNNPLIGKIDHTGGGITRDPGSVVEGAPTHRTRDDLMATGGIVGLAQGGRIGFQPGGPAGGASAGGDYGGNVNPEQEYAGRTFEETYRGDNELSTDTPVIPPQDNFTVDTDLLSTSPNVEFNYSPNNLAHLRALIYNKDVTSEDDINLEGEFMGNKGLIDYGINFTDAGITSSNVGMGPFRADISPNKNIDLSYTNNIKGWDVNAGTNLQDTASLMASKDGWYGGINYNPDSGASGEVGWRKTWGGEPEQTYNNLSWRNDNPNLIYGMEGQNLRYGGLASIL